MAKTVYYRQCRLVKPTPTGAFVQVSWIPDQFAEVGRVLKLRSDGVWDDGWEVRGVGTNRLESNQVPDYHDLIRGHRRATGDAETRAKG